MNGFLKTKQLPVLLSVILISVSCGGIKTGTSTRASVPSAQPLDGFIPHVISLPSTRSATANQPLRVEIIPGKTMQVDCNIHTLAGEFQNRELSDGNRYYVFESDGRTASTMMACPDNTTRSQFVQGSTFFMDVNNGVAPVVYTSPGIDVRSRVWTSSLLFAMGQEVDSSIQTEAARELRAAFPESLEGYDRYVVLLPQINNSQTDRKVEIIPGVLTEVDCNNHRLMGTFVEKNIEGWGYTYLVFESTGETASTRMACPDNSRHTQVVTGPTHLMDYNSRLPVVVFVPQNGNFSVQYRVWEAGQTQSSGTITFSNP